MKIVSSGFFYVNYYVYIYSIIKNKKMTKLHIYNDLGIYKNVIKQQIKDYSDMLSTNEANERGLTEAAALINKRTQMYTLTEAECLISWYISSHDECVVDNPEDFHPLQIHTATAKLARYDKAYSKIKSLQIESMESFQLAYQLA